MAKKLRIVLAQLNLTVGDITGNITKLIESANHARDNLGADIIVFPELSITGYPPDDLLFRKSFIEASQEALTLFKEKVKNIHCIIGHPHLNSQGLFNSCSLIYNATILGRYDKQYLPNYGVFDEPRYFKSGNSACVLPIHGIPVGITICEDLWHSSPIQQAAHLGARLIISPNASPFEIDKHEQRHLTLSKRAKVANVPIFYVNCVGGQDELVFDGGSMVIDQNGSVVQHATFFHETLFTVDIEVSSTTVNLSKENFTLPNEEQRVYDCLVLGVKDYVQKNGFPGVLVGVSGGIDSALTLAIAVDALGKENVNAILLPSRYTSEQSMSDAYTLIDNLGVNSNLISIEPTFESFLQSLEPSFSGKESDLTEQNLQSRCRGVIMMALSNKFGNLVLTTGNRSEMAVGYATLYGDMAGGFAVLKDVPKTLVYQLVNYRNQLGAVIPESIVARAPSAELALNQTDQDTLPPYDVLDKIIELYINQELGVKEIINQGFDENIVKMIVSLIHRSEYKRRQSPLGIRINHKAFSRDRRYPITSKFDR